MRLLPVFRCTRRLYGSDVRNFGHRFSKSSLCRSVSNNRSKFTRHSIVHSDSRLHRKKLSGFAIDLQCFITLKEDGIQGQVTSFYFMGINKYTVPRIHNPLTTNAYGEFSAFSSYQTLAWLLRLHKIPGCAGREN